MRRPVVLDPIVFVPCFGLIALLVVLFRLSQPTTAWLVLLFFLTSVFLSATNGLILLFLVPPLFNGDDFGAYFFPLEILIYLTLFVGFASHLRRRRTLAFPLAPVFILFLISTTISIPLNLKETWLEVQASSWPEIFESILGSDLAANLFYARTLLNALTGVGLYVLVVNERWSREVLLRLAVAATLLYAAVSLSGLWLYHFHVLPNKVFLTLWLGGELSGGFTGLGLNVSYFAQYALAYLPLLGLVLVERTPSSAKAVALATLLLSGYTILVTYQRGAYVVFAVELCLLLVAALSLGPTRRSVERRLLLAGVATVLLIAGSFLSLTPAGPRVYARMLTLWHEGDTVRTHLLGVVWRMFLDQPLLGVGSGRFAHLFQFYSSQPGMQFGSWSAHNLYAQFLAEQGALGLVSFVLIVSTTLVPIILGQHRLEDERPAVLFLLVSLLSWLTYGWLQYTFLMRSMQVYFWITLGLLVSLASKIVPSMRVPRRSAAVVLALLVLAGALRTHTAITRPVPPDYAWGFYPEYEGRLRWTHRVAFMNVRVKSSVLQLTFACPIPQVVDYPQWVSIALDGSEVLRVTLNTPSWKTVEIPVAKPVGSVVLVQLRVRYTFSYAALGLNSYTQRFGILLQPIRWTDPQRT